MGHRLAFLSAFLIVSCILLSQVQVGSRSYITEYRKAEQLYNAENANVESDSLALLHYQKTIDLLSKKNTDDSVFFDAYVKAGILCMSVQKDSLSLVYFSHSIALQQNTQSIADSLLFKPYLFAGNCYYNLYNFDSASYYYKQAEIIQQKYPATPEAERLFNKAGVLYYETGDYKKSILYFSKALSTVEAAPEGKQYFIINYKNNIASALRKMENYDEALRIYKSLLQYKINTNELWHNIGVTYLDAGNYDEAIHYLQKADYNTIAKYNDISKAYIKKRDYTAASASLQTATDLQKASGSRQKSVQYGITLKYLGDIQMAVQAPAKAAAFYQQAIIEMDPDFYDSSITVNPVSFNGLHQYAYLFDALVAKARAITRMDGGKGTELNLRSALAAYRSSLELASHVEKLYETDEARLFLKKNADTVYHEYASVGLQIYTMSKKQEDLEQVFSTIENSKASVLQTDLQELELSTIPGLPQGLLREQKKLKTELARMNIQDSASSIKFRDIEIRLSHLQEQLNDDPKYRSLKFISRQTGVDTIQKKLLQDDDAILSYYYSGNQLICFYITRDKFGYSSVVKPVDFNGKIFQLRKLLNSPENGDRKTISELSKYLFTQLIIPVIPAIEHKKHLIIIPYNEIGYIPFEILTDPANEVPLVQQHAIRYNYSVNFLSGKMQQDEGHAILAMAPFTSTSGEQDQPVLKASEEEVQHLKGKVLLGQAATKTNFEQLLGQYSIIHLATHAIANDNEPIQSYISFYGKASDSAGNKRLYAPEIYNLDMSHVKLVILSACETGNGQLVNGEGIMSLSRAFAYAGCKTAVASLWKADDVATAFITRKMHEYLAAGKDKDIALQEAKLDYLNSDKIEARFKTPAYWSHLILIGENQPVAPKPFNWILIGIAGLGIATALFMVIKKAARN